MDEITVEFADGAIVTAHVVASEPAADLALLRVHTLPTSFKVAPLADSDSVRVGDQVLVVGAPYGLGRSFSVGWISARYPPNTVYRDATRRILSDDDADQSGQLRRPDVRPWRPRDRHRQP